MPAEGADSDTLQSLSVRRDSDGQFRPVDPDASNIELLRPGGGPGGMEETYEGLSSARPLGSIQRNSEDSSLVLDTVTETGSPLYRLNDSSGAEDLSPAAPPSSTETVVDLEDDSVSPHAWRGTPAPTESPIPKLPGNSSFAPDVRYNLVVDDAGIERLVKDPNGPYKFEAAPSGGWRVVADPNSPVPAPRDLRGYDVVKGAQLFDQYRLIELGSDVRRQKLEFDPDVRYDLAFDEFGNHMLVEVPDGDYALRKDANGEFRAVPNPELKQGRTPPTDFQGYAVTMGNDGKVRLLERFSLSLLADGRGGHELVRDPVGPYMFQFDTREQGRLRLVAAPEAFGADPLVDPPRLNLVEQNGRLLLLPPGASEPGVVRHRPHDPPEVFYHTLEDPNADVGRRPARPD